MDLRHYASVIRRRWAVILAWVLILGLASAVYAATRPSEYVASTKLVVATPDEVASFGELYPSSVVFPDRDLATRAQAVLSGPVLDAAGEKVGLDRTALERHVTVAPVGTSNVLLVTATDADAKRGAEAANAVAQAYIDELRRNQKERLAVVRRTLESDLADATREYERLTQDGSEAERMAALSMVTDATNKLNTLRVLENSDGSDTFVLAAAQPATTSSGPTPLRSGLLGATLGLVLGLVHAFTAEYLDQRVRSCAEAAKLLRAPLLAGSLDQDGSVKPANWDERDAYWLGTRELASTRDETGRVLAFADVDRAAAIDVAEVARMFATHVPHVALVSARFGDDSAARSFAVDGRVGLGQVLEGQTQLADALTAVEGSAVLFVPAGGVPENPVRSLGSERMQRLLAELKERADIVVLDMPALSDPHAQAVLEAVAPFVDAAVPGVRCGRSTGPACTNARSVLDQAGVRVVGVVALASAQ